MFQPGQIDRAFELYYDLLRSEGLQPSDRPNSITCSGLIDSCLKQGLVDKAFSVGKITYIMTAI